MSEYEYKRPYWYVFHGPHGEVVRFIGGRDHFPPAARKWLETLPAEERLRWCSESYLKETA